MLQTFIFLVVVKNSGNSLTLDLVKIFESLTSEKENISISDNIYRRTDIYIKFQSHIHSITGSVQ